MKKILGIIMLESFLLLCGCHRIPENTVFSLEDLKGKKIGVQIQTTGDIYATDIENADVKRFNKGKDAVAALREGEIDAVILDDGPARLFVEEFKDIRILDESYEEEEYGIAVKKGNKELLDKINIALDRIEEDGTLEAIFQNWIYEGGKESAYQRKVEESELNDKLIMVTNAEFPPYESEENGELRGIDIDIMKAICDELNMKLEIQDIAFDSLISAVDRGIADVGVAAISITDDRLKQVDFSESYAKAKQVVIVRDSE